MFQNDIIQLQNRLLASKETPISNQRFEITDDKEKALFFAKMQGQMSRMDNRMGGQDATFAKENARRDFENKLFSLAPRMHNQTASFRRNSVMEPKSPMF